MNIGFRFARACPPSAAFFVVLTLLATASIAGLWPPPVAGRQPDGAAPCLLDIHGPRGIRVSLNGEDHGEKTSFSYGQLTPGLLYKSSLSVRLPDGSEETREVLLRSGERVVVTVGAAQMGHPELVSQTGHSAAEAVCTSDGKHLFTRSGSTVLLWNTETSLVLRAYEHPQAPVRRLAIDEPRRRLATVDASNTIRIWDYPSGQILRTIPNAQSLNVTLTIDGRTALVNRFQHCELLDLEDGSLQQTLSKRQDPQATSDFNFTSTIGANQNYAFTAVRASQVLMWDCRAGKIAHVFNDIPGEEITAIECDPTGSFVAVTARTTDVKANVSKIDVTILDVQQRRIQATASWQPGYLVDRVLIMADRKQVLASGRLQSEEGRFLDLCSLVDLSRSKTLVADQIGSCLLQLPGDSETIFDGRNFRKLDDWEAARPLSGLLLSPSSTRLTSNPPGVSFTAGRSVYLWNDQLADLRKIAEIADSGGIQSADLTPDGQQCIAKVFAHGGQEVRLLNTATGQSAGAFATPRDLAELRLDRAKRLAFFPNVQQSMEVWSLSAGRKLQSFPTPVPTTRGANLSPDGRRVIGPDDAKGEPGQPAADGAIYDVATGRKTGVLRIPPLPAPYKFHSIYGRSFSPGGRWIALWGHIAPAGGFESRVGAIWLFNAETLQSVHSVGGHRGTCHEVAFSGDDRIMASYSRDDRLVIAWTTNAGRDVRGIPAALQWEPPLLSADGRWLYLLLADNVIDVWDLLAGEKVLRFAMMPGDDWMAVTPQGLFDGTAEGRKAVAFRVGGGLNVYPVDRFFQDFYSPGLLSAVRRGERPLPASQVGGSLPPLVRITGPRPGEYDGGEEVLVTVEALDQGGGVHGPFLRHNGAKLAAAEPLEQDGKSFRQRYRVQLVEGENRLRAEAASGDGSWESEPVTLRLEFARSLNKPDLYLLAAGVNQYADPAMNLRFAASDVRAIAEVFQKRGATLYSQIHVATLIDQDATKAKIRSALEKIAAQARPQDTLVVFLSGHGFTVGQRYYFIPHEFQSRGQRFENDVRDFGYPGDELSDAIGAVPALKRILIFDTCNSGGALNSAGNRQRNAFAFRGAIERLSRAQGIFAIAASSASEETTEIGELEHGLLTYTLLAGLKAVDKGPLADLAIQPSEKSGVVSVLEWFDYANQQVPELTRRYVGQAMDVKMSGEGTSFPLLPAVHP